ncbi:MAG: S41 family peptidase [Planctomycetaceae bacterium]
MRLPLLALLLLTALQPACRLAPASALQQRETRAAVASRLLRTLDEQGHYFSAEETRRGFAERLETTVREADDALSFYERISRNLATLKEGHTGLADSAGVSFLQTVPPVALLELEGRVVVAGVAPGVEGGGLRPGDVILAVDGLPVSEALDRQVAQVAGSTPHARRSRAVANLLAGPAALPAQVAVLGVDGRTRLAYPLRFLLDDEGEDRFRFGFVRQAVVARRLDLATGYVALPDFQEARVEETADALRALLPLPRLVLDLRGNPGGRIRTMQGIAGFFLGEGTAILTMHDRAKTETLYALPASLLYPGRLALLVDERTGSAAELLAAALRDRRRARIFGWPTAGSTRTRQSALLPGGVLFYYASGAELRRLDGSRVEGVGVEPDERVVLTREALATGAYGDPLRDPAVARAARGIAPHP